MAMEFNGVFMRTIDPRPCVSVRGLSRTSCEFKFPDSKLCARSLRGRAVVGEAFAFDDKRLMEYYNCCAGTTSGEQMVKEKMVKKMRTKKEAGVSSKKRAKLVKDLTRNLCKFSELGFGLESDEAKVKAISEAALVLQAHLEHLRAEGKKLKKEDKMKSDMDDSESSSSSESSDSECDEDRTVSMSTLCKQVAAKQIVEEPMISELHGTMATSPKQDSLDTSKKLKRVEVCTGKKCTKMGAPALMEEFRSVLGEEGLVVECKCLGKCNTAPNVRIHGSGEDDADEDDDSVRSRGNSLCLGVGQDDVGFIMANYFGS